MTSGENTIGLAEPPAVAPQSEEGKLRTGLARAVGWYRGLTARMEPHRRLLLALAVLLFVAGTVWSIRALELSWSELWWTPLIAAFLLVAPALWLNGAELTLCARATRRTMPLLDAVVYTSTATVANLLPIPASALIRGGALVNRGASLFDSGKIIFNVGLLWLGLAASVSIVTIGIGAFGLWLALIAIAVAVAAFAGIAHQGGIGLALQLLAVRIAILSLSIARLMLCLWAIGAEASLTDAAVYTVAPVVGSAIGIVPAGLGISEAIGAALAVIADAPAAQAFMALGLSRFLALFAAGAVVACVRLLPGLAPRTR